MAQFMVFCIPWPSWTETLFELAPQEFPARKADRWAKKEKCGASIWFNVIWFSMKTDGQRFLDELARLPASAFDNHFAEVSASLQLGRLLGENDLKLLYSAALSALLCHDAINGIGEDGLIKPEYEFERRQLEYVFMDVRQLFHASPGWQCLAKSEQELIERCFLTVSVMEDKLAP